MNDTPPEVASIELRLPTVDDGLPLNKLIARCPPLKQNSVYCNLLHCTHFAATSVALEADGHLEGFISAYLKPQQHPEAIFLWQIAVSQVIRKRQMAQKMVQHILQRSICQDVRYVEATVGESNQASLALMHRLAENLNTQITTNLWFDSEKHFGGEFEDELYIRIGPFEPLFTASKEN